jgi:hypothetical protein
MPELDLEQLVRSVRPEPQAAWTGRMDRRVAEGFPSPPRRWHWRRIPGGVLVAGSAASVILVLVGIVALAGRGNGDGSSSSSSGTASSPAMAAPESAKRDSAGAGAVPPVVSRQRDIIRSVSLTLSTAPADVEVVSDRAIRVADTLGGYVQESSVTARQSAELTLRIPQDKLQQALTRLSRLAHVSSRTQQAQDVTDQRAALEAAVRDARAYRDSLRRRLARATTDREASSLRGRLQRAEQSLRGRERDVARLSAEASLATIDVRVRGDRRGGAAAPAGDRWTPGDALHDAGRVLEVVAGIALIGLALALPIALLAAAAALASRLLTRRRRERALELA